MQLNAYVFFNGRCAEAFRFYEQVLAGKIEMMVTHRDVPQSEEVSEEWKDDAIMHARLVAGDGVLLGSDCPPQYFEQVKGFYVSLGTKDPAEADRIFNALAENGEIRMPIQQTFWARRFAMLTDQFGTPWMINCQ